MSSLLIITMLRCQILALPVFRPSIELIRRHDVVNVYNNHQHGLSQPDGIEFKMRIKF
jgi:hypothetical protein